MSNAAAPTFPAAPRIALYSHDTMGLGHIRRNTLLAQSLIAPPLSADVLLVSGIRESGAFALPRGIDSITLPAYQKQPDGTYRSRSLGLPLEALIELRAQTILAALTAFAPQLFVVDNVPRGALSELDTVLPVLRARGTRIILGLRDIIDTPDTVARQWERLRNDEALQAHFDGIWIYGDTRLYDTIGAYGLDRLKGLRITPVGYLDASLRNEGGASPEPGIEPAGETDHAGAGHDAATAGTATASATTASATTAGTATSGTAATGGTEARSAAPAASSASPHDASPFVRCMMGGGQDGLALAEAFARAPLPGGWRGLNLTRAKMPPAARARLQALVAERPALQLMAFSSQPLELIRAASAVVAMAGYNSTMEVLALEKHTLLVPRVVPREEQWLRASRLADLGLVHCLHPDELSPGRVGEWLAHTATGTAPRPRAREVLDFSGLQRVVREAAALLGHPAASTPAGSAAQPVLSPEAPVS